MFFKKTIRIINKIVRFLGIAAILFFVVGIVMDNINSDKSNDFHTEQYSRIHNELNDIDEKIILAWKNDDVEMARNHIRERFNIEISTENEDDEIMGYVVAAHFSRREFKQAAIAVLERDKNKAPYDWSLKCDLAQCMRNYTIKEGEIAGLKLIETLTNEYGNKLLSVFWTVLPISFVREVEDGIFGGGYIYSSDSKANFQKKIKSLINLYPNDKFIDYAYLSIGQYKSVMNRNSRIKNIALLANGFTIYRGLKSDYYDFSEKQTDTHSFDLKFTNGAKLDKEFLKKKKAAIIECLKIFSDFNDISTQQRMSDDVFVKIGLLHSYLGDYENAIKSYLKAGVSGNGDMYYNAKWRIEHIVNINSSDTERIIQFNSIIKKHTDNISNQNFNIFNNFKEEKPLDYLEIRCKQLTQDRFQKEVNLIALSTIQTNGNLNNYISIRESFGHLFKDPLLLKVNHLLDIGNINEGSYNILLSIKNNSKCRVFSYQLIEHMKRKKMTFNLMPKLLYTQINIIQKESCLYDYFEEILNQFLSKYSDNELADDVIAESILRNVSLRKLDAALDDLKKINTLYPEGNARDNALNWIAIGFYKEYKWTDEIYYLTRAKHFYEIIIKDYNITNSRFVKYSRTNLKRIKKDFEEENK